MDITQQEKGGPTVDYYPEGHPFEGQLIFYKEWLALNPYRRLTDIARWNAIHVAVIQGFLEIRQATKGERRLAWEEANPDKLVAHKKEESTPFTGDLTGALSAAINSITNPERAAPVGELNMSPEPDYPEDDPPSVDTNPPPEEDPDELS